MTEIEKFTRLVLDSVYTSLPCKVLEYDGATRFAKCQLMIQTAKDTAPLIRVPVLRMIGGSVPLHVGMIIPVFFSKYSLGEFAVSLSQVAVKPSLECLQFTRDSAYGLPFVFDDKLNIQQPDFVEFDTRVIFKETVLMEKHVECLEVVDMKSDLNVTGNQTTIGITKTGKIDAPNYNSHTHMEQGDGKATSGPNQ